LENYRAIRQELELFDPLLAKRPELVVITKADLPEAAQVREQFAEQLGTMSFLNGPYLICSLSGEGLPELLRAIQAEFAPSLTW
jgi:GTP-binding protein